MHLSAQMMNKQEKQRLQFCKEILDLFDAEILYIENF
jgi:hypothetical protein